jgi:predicted rRNA methylase YqxC with S4 and FtsJ domains
LDHTVEAPSWVVALLKPQFEAEYTLSAEEMKAFNGIITEEAQRQRIKDATLADLAERLDGWHLAGQAPSPIRGAKCGIRDPVDALRLWRNARLKWNLGFWYTSV